MYRRSEPPLSKTIVLARMGKEDVEGEGVGGEVWRNWGAGSGGSNLRFSKWLWFSLDLRSAREERWAVRGLPECLVGDNLLIPLVVGPPQ